MSRWIVWVLVIGSLCGVWLLVAVSATLQKSTLTWPVAAPTRVANDAAPDSYRASGWIIASPFGWRPDPEHPQQYELHDGIDLAGTAFCFGCAMPPLSDVQVTHVGWDQPDVADPLHAGTGVVVDMALQHPNESGLFQIRYGHLQPYYVDVRTRSCQQNVDCPDYHNDGAASIMVNCQGPLVETGSSSGQRRYAYATPGQCVATVTWPAPYEAQGATTITFDQQIQPGVAASDAALTFTAQLPPPPPTITPTIALPPEG